jgi:ABC-type multidrug transport system fused ATPase/permease subunit
VFDHGRIVEMGTFQELQRSGGVFTRLITEQFAGLGASEEPAMQVRPQ